MQVGDKMTDIYNFSKPIGLTYIVMEVLGLSCGKNIQVVVFPPETTLIKIGQFSESDV